MILIASHSITQTIFRYTLKFIKSYLPGERGKISRQSFCEEERLSLDTFAGWIKKARTSTNIYPKFFRSF
jgi:hypothetical protein